MNNIRSLISKVKSWGNSKPDIIAIALVGSYATNKAGENSDVDLMILCKDPDYYITDEDWITQFGKVKEIKNEVWSQLKTKRIFFQNGLEVEFNFDRESWANPQDSGTKRVISDGIKILIDKRKLLQTLI